MAAILPLNLVSGVERAAEVFGLFLWKRFFWDPVGGANNELYCELVILSLKCWQNTQHTVGYDLFRVNNKVNVEEYRFWRVGPIKMKIKAQKRIKLLRKKYKEKGSSQMVVRCGGVMYLHLEGRQREVKVIRRMWGEVKIVPNSWIRNGERIVLGVESTGDQWRLREWVGEGS